MHRMEKQVPCACEHLDLHPAVISAWHYSATKGLPLPLGRGVCETKSKNGRSRPRKPFISRVFCAPRGIETMVDHHGLGRGQTMGWGSIRRL